MVSLDGRPGRLDATFRPDDSFTVNLTGPAGWLSSRAFTATLGGVALSVSENGDVLTVVASAAITLAATSPAQFVLTLTGGNDALVGTWSARTDGSAQTSTSAAVIIDSLDVAVTLGGDSADLNAHIADAVGAHAASAVSITDAAGDFTATDVEGALAELQTDLEALPGTYGTLARTTLLPAVLETPQVTNSTWADVDATDLVVTFTVPANGKVKVRLEAACDAGSTGANGYAWGLREGTTLVPTSDRIVHRGGTANGARISTTIYLSGLTPGASVTYKWAHAQLINSNAGRMLIGGTGSVNYGPAIMEVSADPLP